MQHSLRYTLSISLALSLFSGCALKPTPPAEITIDPTLPVPSLNGSLSDIKSIAFEWKAISDPRVSGYSVYRSTPSESNQTLTRIATIESRFATHFVDEQLAANTPYLYRFTTTGSKNTESNASETMEAVTLPMIAPVSFFQSFGSMPRSAKLIWRPHTNTRINSYAIDRFDVNNQTWSEIATVKGRLNAEYIDPDLKDGQVYHYRVRAITFDGLSTLPSETGKLSTKPLPDPLKNISATADLPKAISLKWDPTTLSDFSHYNIYRASSSHGNYEYRVKLFETTFTDILQNDGESFFYKITVVDKDGLESLMGETGIQGTSQIKPRTPYAFDGKIHTSGVTLQWTNDDPRTVSYTVIKTTKTSWITRESLDINNIKELTFTDTNITPNVEYTYQVMSVDKDGIRSLPTSGIDLKLEVK